MPGIVTQAVASTVLPYALANLFTQSYTWPVVENGPFPDGSYLRETQGAAVRLGWTLSRRLTSAEYSALLTFFSDRKGSLQAFYFYPVQSQHDATGVATTGRHLVRFEGALTLTHQIGRDTGGFGLVQVQ